MSAIAPEVPSHCYSAHDLPEVDVPVGILRIANQLTPTQQGGRMILLTSHAKGEGKSLAQQHIARVLAKYLGQRVLLVDLQERSSESLGPHHFSPVGLESTSLRHVTRLEWHIEDDQKYAFLQERMGSWRESYDIVLVEAPSIQSATTLDPIVFGALFDMVILMFHRETTYTDELRRSLELLERGGASDVRLLINQSSVLEKQVSRWNLPARIPRFLARLQVLWHAIVHKLRSQTPQESNRSPQ